MRFGTHCKQRQRLKTSKLSAQQMSCAGIAAHSVSSEVSAFFFF